MWGRILLVTSGACGGNGYCFPLAICYGITSPVYLFVVLELPRSHHELGFVYLMQTSRSVLWTLCKMIKTLPQTAPCQLHQLTVLFDHFRVDPRLVAYASHRRAHGYCRLSS